MTVRAKKEFSNGNEMSLGCRSMSQVRRNLFYFLLEVIVNKRNFY